MYNDNNNSGHCSSFQLALFVHDDGKGVTLTDVPFLCTEAQREECSTVYPLKFPDCVSTPFLLLTTLVSVSLRGRVFHGVSPQVP